MENLEQIIKDHVNAPNYLNLLDVVQTKNELEVLFQKYPKTFASEEKRNKINTIFENWVFLNDEVHKKVICLYEDPDDLARNDAWGGKEVYCVIVVNSGKHFSAIGQKVKDFYLD